MGDRRFWNQMPLRNCGGKARRAWGTLALQTARIVVHITRSEANSHGHGTELKIPTSPPPLQSPAPFLLSNLSLEAARLGFAAPTTNPKPHSLPYQQPRLPLGKSAATLRRPLRSGARVPPFAELRLGGSRSRWCRLLVAVGAAVWRGTTS
jgi:hypothetical protein